jgi:hypothetical protein
VKGSDALTDEAIAKLEDFNTFLRQDMSEKGEYEADIDKLKEIVDREEIPVPSEENREAEAGQEEANTAHIRRS